MHRVLLVRTLLIAAASLATAGPAEAAPATSYTVFDFGYPRVVTGENSVLDVAKWYDGGHVRNDKTAFMGMVTYEWTAHLAQGGPAVCDAPAGAVDHEAFHWMELIQGAEGGAFVEGFWQERIFINNTNPPARQHPPMPFSFRFGFNGDRFEGTWSAIGNLTVGPNDVIWYKIAFWQVDRDAWMATARTGGL